MNARFPTLLLVLATAVACSSSRGSESISGGADVADTADADVGLDAPPDALDAADASSEVDAADVADEPDGPWFPTVVVAVETRLSADTVRAGDSVFVHCDAVDQDGELVTLDPGVSVAWIIAPDDSLVPGDEPSELIAARAGNASISCTIPSLSLIDATPADIVIDPGAPYTILTEVENLTIPVGERNDVYCSAYDRFGNYIPNAELEVLVDPFREGVEVYDTRLVIWRTGLYTITCSAPGATELISEVIEVRAGLPATLVVGIEPDRPMYTIGDVVSLTWVVLDEYGNIVESPPVRFSSVPPVPGFGEGRFRFDREGLFRLTVFVPPPTATGEPLVGFVEVIVNEAGPTIECVFPPYGSMIDGPIGAPVLIEGMTEDALGVASVTVNGEEAFVRPDGSFVIELPGDFGVNFMHVEALDEFGGTSTRTCVYLMSENWVEEAGFFDDDIALELTQDAFDDRNRSDGLDSLNDLVYTIMNAPNLQSMINSTLLAANPIFPRTCVLDSWFGCLVSVGVEFRYLRLGGPQDSAITLVEDGMRLSVDIRDIELGLRITGTFGTSGHIDVSSFGLTMTLNVGLVGGRPRVNIRTLDRVDVGSLDSDFSGITGFVIDILFDIFEGTIRNLIREQLRGFVADEVNTMLDEMFSELDIETLGDVIPVPRLDGSGVIDLGFGIRFSTVDFDPTRGIIAFGTRFTAPIEHGAFTYGSARPPGSVLDDGPTTRTTKVAFNLGMLNQIMHTLWRAGLFDVTVGGAEIGGTLPEGMTVTLYSNLPPVVVGYSDTDVEIQMGGMRAEVAYPALLPEPIIFHTGVKLTAGVELIGADELDFRDIVITDFYFDALQAGLDAETTRTLEDFVVEVVQYVLDSAINSALPNFPIPSFEIPPEAAEFGLPAGAYMGILDPVLEITTRHFLLQGNFGTR